MYCIGSNDGYCNQYQCDVSLYFLSLLSSNFNLAIDIMISASGHGEYIVDDINTCDKQYLRSRMHMVETPITEDGKNKIEAHYIVGVSKSSFAKECNRLFEDEITIKGKRKYQ